MNEIILSVTGMTCGGCVNSVQKVLTALPGVQSVEVTLTPGQARVVVDPARVDRAALVQAVVDAGFGIIRRLAFTPAHVNESIVADALICGDEAAVYADKGYESKKRRAELKTRHIKDRIMHRSHKNQDGLPYWQKRRNALIAPRRAPVERVFGNFKRLYRRGRARYSNFLHNLGDFQRLATAYNLRRAVSLASL